MASSMETFTRRARGIEREEASESAKDQVASRLNTSGLCIASGRI